MSVDDTVDIGFMAIMAVIFVWGFGTFVYMLASMAYTWWPYLTGFY